MHTNNGSSQTLHKNTAVWKSLILVLACCVTLLFSACSPADADNNSENQTTSTTTGTADVEETVDESTESDDGQDENTNSNGADDNEAPDVSGFSAADLAIVIDGTNFVLLEDAAGLLAILGDDYAYSEAESCVFEGMDKTFDFGDILVYTIPSGETDLLDGYDILGGDQTTAAGIALGSTRADVISAYGEPADDSDYMVYNESADPENIDEPRLTIVLDGDGIVSMISYYSGSNAQG